MSFFDGLVRRPVTVFMLAIAAAVFGLVSYRRLPLTLMPDLSYPTITVRTEVSGAAPEEVESQVARPIEEALSTVEGLVRLESRSRAGLADVTLQFTWGTDMDQASQSVRERLQTTWLPDDAARPLILRYDPNLDPILRIALAYEDDAHTGEAGELLLRQIAEGEVKRPLEAMDGIAAVRVRGGLEREVLLSAREDWLVARGVTMDQLIATLGAENVNLPGGSIYQGDQEYLVRTLGEVRTLDEIRALQIARPDGVLVPVSEVATVTDGHKEREVVSLLGGRPAVELEVFKSADANIVRVASALKARLGAGGRSPGTVAASLPEDVTVKILDDQAVFIEQSLANLRSALLQGALLSVAVIYAFLRNWRNTLIISTAIPLSLICAMAPMYLGHVSLNLMSLGGLALGVGMIVDNATVVLDSVQVYLDRGLGRVEAAVRGTAEVAMPVAASTATTVGVFLPIAFVEGVAGQVFGDLSLAVVYSMMASLAVALLFVPMLAALDLTPPTERGALRDVSPSARFPSVADLRAAWRAEGSRRWLRRLYALARFPLQLSWDLMRAAVVLTTAPLARLSLGVIRRIIVPLAGLADRAAGRFHAFYLRQAERYATALAWMLARPGAVLGGVSLLVLVTALLGAQLGQALIPEVHQGRFDVDLARKVGTPLGSTLSTAELASDLIGALPGVEGVHATVGAERRADSKPDEGEHTARLSVQMTPEGDIEAREAPLMDAIRSTLSKSEALDDVEVRIARPGLFTFETPVEVVIYDQDLRALRASSDHMVSVLQGLSGLRDVRSSLVDGYPEIRVRYDRDLLMRYGLDTSSAAQRVREKVLGERATRLSRGEGRVDLIVQIDADERRGLDDLKRLNVNPRLTPNIPLEAVATFEEGEGPSEIRRLDQRRAAVITANVEGLSLSKQAEAATAALRQANIPSEWEIAGQDEEMRRSLESLGFAMALATFLVYVVMACTFESIVQPFVILASLPLAIIGVVPALFLTGTPVSVVVLIGAIVLAGVVVNNAIVLIDCINRNREEGMPRVEAIQQAARLRLRPILITALTTIFGLVPLSLGFGEGAEVQQPLALTIMMGLTSSTFLTLGIVPVVYERVTAFLERGRPAAANSTADGA